MNVLLVNGYGDNPKGKKNFNEFYTNIKRVSLNIKERYSKQSQKDQE